MNIPCQICGSRKNVNSTYNSYIHLFDHICRDCQEIIDETIYETDKTLDAEINFKKHIDVSL